MSEQSGRRSPSRAQRREDAMHGLLAAAAELDTGPGDLTVERMARRAGISRATFYIYFEDKAELVQAWCDLVENRTAEVSLSWSEHDGPATWQQVRSTLGAVAAVRREYRTAVAAVEEAAAAQPRLRRARADARTARVDALRDHIERGQAGGWVDPALRPAPTAEWLTAMVDRVSEHVLPRRSPSEVDRLLDAGSDIVWTSLYGARS